jgi:hypothetical protein
MQRLPLQSGTGVFNSKFILMLYLPFALNWHFWWGNWVKRAKNDPVLVLNAKGWEIKAKANGSANHLWILKTIELELLICPKYSYCKIWFLVGENFDYGKKGEFLALDQFFFSWNMSRFAQTSVFDLEIGKRIWFAKTNQVVAKSDLNMPNYSKKQLDLQFEVMLHVFCCFLMCWHNSPKRGRWKGKYALGQFL